MDFSILYMLQGIRCGWLDQLMLVITKLAGDYGQIWAVTGAVLCLFKKTRKCGIEMLISYGLVYLIGQYGLKDLIARPRPCHIDQTVELLVKRPSSYSCPSTHSAWAAAGAAVIFMNHRKAGIMVSILAALICFSRLYLFVHFPSDVLCGIVLGILCAIAAVKAVNGIVHMNKLKYAKKQ